MPEAILSSESATQFAIDGWLGARIGATIHNWMLRMPGANPALLQMFRDRDLHTSPKSPSVDLLPWSGEFAGKFLIAGAQFARLSRDPSLIASLQLFVDALVACQDGDGYQGAFERSARMLGRPVSQVWSTFFPGAKDPAQWNDWFALDARELRQGSKITTLSTTPGATSLYVLDGDGTVMTNFFPAPDSAPRWTGWFALPGDKTFPVASTLTALSTHAGGTSLYVLGEDGLVWTNFFPAADGTLQWNGWFALGVMAFPAGSPVSALSTVPGGTSLYMQHADGQVYTNYFPAPDHSDRWTDWFPLPGDQRFPGGSTITTLSTTPGGTSLYVLDGDGKLLTNFFPAADGTLQWNGWVAIDDTIFPAGSTVTALSTRPGATSLYVLDGNGRVVTNFFPAANGAWQWNGWFALGDNTFPTGSTVTALSTRMDGTSLYVLGSDAKVWTNFFPAADGTLQWNGWFALGDRQFPKGAKIAALSALPGETSLYVRDDDSVVWTNLFPDPDRPNEWSDWWPLVFPPYASWLPAPPGLQPVPFSRTNPLREQRAPLQRVILDPGTPQRVCQLTGEHDRTQGRPAPGQSQSTVGLVGTDLGASVDLGDRNIFLFGDTWPDPALGDSLGWTTDLDVSSGMALTFASDPAPIAPQRTWRKLVLLDGAAPNGQRDTGVFDVPTGGFFWRGRLYVIYSQGHDPQVVSVMPSSVLCRADDPGDLTRLTVLYELSRVDSTGPSWVRDGHFVNAAPAVVESGSGDAGPTLYVWGSGDYRNDHVHLAKVPLTSIDDPSMLAWRFWNGSTWVGEQAGAAALFIDGPPRVGELSAAWVPALQSWLVTYQVDLPRGVWFRTAPAPMGPYSEAQLLYHGDWPEVGYGRLMHRAWDAGGVQGTDDLYDCGRGEEWGGEYGPYLISRFMRDDGQGQGRIAFVLSSWNPYQVHLFTATLRWSVSPGNQPPPVSFTALPPPTTPVDGVVMIAPDNFELLAPARTGGLWYRERDNTTPGLPWSDPVLIGLGSAPGQPATYGAASLLRPLLNVRPDMPGLESRRYAVARAGDAVVYLWRGSADDPAWRGPYPVIAVELDDGRIPFTGAAGNVCFIRSHYGALKQNWELVAPASRGGGVMHFWRDNDPVFPLKGDWRVAPRFLASLGQVDAVALIESHLEQDAYALEAVVRVGNRLWLAWRNPALVWSAPSPLVADGGVVDDAVGAPCLMQSMFGSRQRNFELVTPCAGGGLAHYWRNNDGAQAADWRWQRTPGFLDSGNMYTCTSIIESRFGTVPGNLEFVARTAASEVMHFWRDTTTMQWNGPFPLLLD